MKKSFCVTYDDAEVIKWFLDLHQVCYENEHPEYMTFMVSKAAEIKQPDSSISFKSEISRVQFSRQMTEISSHYIQELERMGDWLPKTLLRSLEKKAMGCPICSSEYCPGFMVFKR